jgi:hypothetical protein
METFDLEPFANYIRQRHLAEERHVPYCVRWVRQFLTAELPSVATSPKDHIQAFEDHLSNDHASQDWQLRQALKAVELYVRVFVTASPSEPISPELIRRDITPRKPGGYSFSRKVLISNGAIGNCRRPPWAANPVSDTTGSSSRLHSVASRYGSAHWIVTRSCCPTDS